MRLLLAETSLEASRLMDETTSEPSSWLALSPGAMWTLDQHREKYNLPEEFYSEQKLAQYCLGLHQGVEDLCCHLDQRLHQGNSWAPEWFRPFTCHLAPLIVLWDSLAGRIFQLRKALNALKPSELVVVGRPLPREADFGPGSFAHKDPLLWGRNDTLWGWLLQLPDWDLPVQVLPPTKAEEAERNLNDMGWRNKLKASSLLYTLVARRRGRDYRGGLAGSMRSGSSLLLLNSSYGWSHAVPLLRAQRWRIRYRRNFHFAPDRGEAEGHVPKNWDPDDPMLRSMACQFGVDLSSLLLPRLAWLWSQAGRYYAQAQAVRRFVRQHEVKGILSGTLSLGDSRIICEAARQEGAKVILWQHGAVIKQDNFLQLNRYNDLAGSDVLLAFGPGAAEAYTSHLQQDSPVVQPVGSPVLEEIRREWRKPDAAGGERRKPIVYVTTNYYENPWYYGYYPGLSDRLLYQSQISLLGRLETLLSTASDAPDVTLRLYPGLKTLPPWGGHYAARPGFTLASPKKSLRQIFLESGAVVLDFPSTTLLEALSTTLPVFVLMKFWRFDPRARSQLAQRAVVANDDQALADAVEAYVLHGSYPPDCQDREFLRNWGVHRDDGASCRRAVDIVAQWCRPPIP